MKTWFHEFHCENLKEIEYYRVNDTIMALELHEVVTLSEYNKTTNVGRVTLIC